MELTNRMTNMPISFPMTHRAAKVKRVVSTFYSALTSDPVIVLNYHRIHSPTSEANNLTVSTDHFREQMRYLKDHCQVISLRNIHNVKPDYFKNRFFTKRRVAITFDDGYADTLTHAVPILDEYGIPASVYIASNVLGRSQEFWWDEVEDLLLERLADHDFLKLKTIPAEFLFETNTKKLKNRAEIYRLVCHQMKHSPLIFVERMLSDLRSQLKVPPVGRSSHRPLTVEELKNLARNPLIEIGGHTLDHLCMGDLNYDEQSRQISESKKKIEEITGLPVTSFAYPYGEMGDFNEASFLACTRAGIKTAYTTVPGLLNHRTHAFSVPRMFVKNWGQEHFRNKLRQFFWTGRA